MSTHKKTELLAPAGDLEKIKVAVTYGADAVYFGGKFGSLRSASANLSLAEIRDGISYCRSHGVKAYLALNIIAHDEDFPALREMLLAIADLATGGTHLDGIILSDPGVLFMVKEIYGECGAGLPEIHISTQANVTNSNTVNFWYEQGARRVILARELSLDEIVTIRRNIPDDMTLEAFVHGSMCVSYSGRCLLSNLMTGRDGNRGDCSHPCRYKYAVVEEKRPGEYMPIEEDERGTHIMNSKDLCMISHLKELSDAGIESFKIEGRVKSVYYVATAVRAYRAAIDEINREQGGTFCKNNKDDILEFTDFSLRANRAEYEISRWADELTKASNRLFTTGFFFGKPSAEAHNYDNSGYRRGYMFVGIVKGDGENDNTVKDIPPRAQTGVPQDKDGTLVRVEQRNKFSVGDELEIFSPSRGVNGTYNLTTGAEDLETNIVPNFNSFKSQNYQIKGASENDVYTSFSVTEMYDEHMNPIDSAPHAQQIVYLRVPYPAPEYSMLRRREPLKVVL